MAKVIKSRTRGKDKGFCLKSFAIVKIDKTEDILKRVLDIRR